jgi:hypothetical protein
MLNIAFVHHFKLEWELETFDSAIVYEIYIGLWQMQRNWQKLILWNQFAIIQDSCGLREIQLPEK